MPTRGTTAVVSRLTDLKEIAPHGYVEYLRVLAELQEDGLLKVSKHADGVQHVERVWRHKRVVGLVLLQVLCRRLQNLPNEKQRN